jgi:hypothetical protein
MFHIASTRFNNSTLAENMTYRHKMGEAALYGTSIRINTKYSIGDILFVVEMNNEENRIEGIAIITNNLVFDKKHKIYNDSDYNRFIYRGTHWLSRDQIIEIDVDLVTIFDTILFKGKSHLKRQSGITVITEKLVTKWNYNLDILKRRLKNIFINKFKVFDDTELVDDSEFKIVEEIEKLSMNN